MAVDVSIIIVNYFSESFIKKCLDCVFLSKTSYLVEVIVIDNNSQDRSPEIINSYSDRITFIKNKENVGFAAANNQGLKIAKGRYTLLLNNDAFLSENAIEDMLSFYDQHPQTGAIVPKLLNADGSLQKPGSSIDHWRYHSKKPRPLSFACGAVVLIQTALFREIDGLDENFFFYNEDIDLSKTLLKKKRPIYYLPSVEVVHYGGASTTSVRGAALVEGFRGGLYLCYKHYPRWVFQAYRMILIFYVFMMMILTGIRFVFDHNNQVQTYLTIMRLAIKMDIYRPK